jgi:hypothetical protein
VVTGSRGKGAHINKKTGRAKGGKEGERDVGGWVRESGVASGRGKAKDGRGTEGRMIRARMRVHGEGPRMESRTG